jgi:hypothetical protein
VGVADARNSPLPRNRHSKSIQPAAVGLPNGKSRAKFELRLVRIFVHVVNKKVIVFSRPQVPLDASMLGCEAQRPAEL